MLAAGAGLLGFAYAGLAAGGDNVAPLAALFVLGGLGMGCVETAEHSAVAALAPEGLRGSAFGLLALIQSAGSLAASAIAGVLWTAISPSLAFGYLAACMLVTLAALASRTAGRRRRRGPRQADPWGGQ
jgi:MFS family permease